LEIGNGPAAVIGDESRNMSLRGHGWAREGAVGRRIRELEDLPWQWDKGRVPRKRTPAGGFGDKKGTSPDRRIDPEIFLKTMLKQR